MIHGDSHCMVMIHSDYIVTAVMVLNPKVYKTGKSEKRETFNSRVLQVATGDQVCQRDAPVGEQTYVVLHHISWTRIRIGSGFQNGGGDSVREKTAPAENQGGESGRLGRSALYRWDC